MTERLEILVEEPSMEFFLRGLLPRVLPAQFRLDENCFIRAHEGKSDLQKSLPKAVQAYKYYPCTVRLLVIQDQDSNDCIVLKKRISDLINNAASNTHSLVRIACKELENWYIGDLLALEQAYPSFKARKYTRKAKYRVPDRLQGADEMRRLVPDFQKIDAARKMARHIEIHRNQSASFQHLVSGVQKLLEK